MLRVRTVARRVVVGTVLAGVVTAVFAGSAAATSPLKSQTWAGYQAGQTDRAGHPQDFRAVGASWAVPQIKCAGVTSRGDADSYLWVGLGSGSSMERVGVRAFCSGTLPAYTTYLEINGLYEVQAISPAEGDSVSATVSYAFGKYRFSLADSTRHESFSVRYSCGAFSAGQGSCNRATAEVGAGIWAPRRSPLTNYGSVTFHHIALTAISGPRGALVENRYPAIAEFDEFDGARLTASPSSLVQKGTSFTDTWSHP